MFKKKKKKKPYLNCLCVCDPVKHFVINFHYLISNSQTLLFSQWTRFYQWHIDPNSMLGSSADAKSQTLVALVTLEGHLSDLSWGLR